MSTLAGDSEVGRVVGSTAPTSVSNVFGRDSTTALGQQMMAILVNLQSTPDSRQLRVEECLSAFMDTSFAHTDEISSNEVLHERLLRQVESTFSFSIDKGCRALRILLDIKWKDQQDKRCRCLDVLVRQAIRCKKEEDCERILVVIGDLLGENVRTTTDMLAEYLRYLINIVFEDPDSCARAAGCGILARMVSTSAVVIKRNPTLLESLTTLCPPSVLLHHAMESDSLWLHRALIRLLTSMVSESCYEVSPQLIAGITEQVNRYTCTAIVESQLVGVLSIISGIATSPVFINAPWDFAIIGNFLTERDWAKTSVATRGAAAYATGKVMRTLLGDEEELYHRLANRLLFYLANDEQEVVIQVLSVLMEMLATDRGIQRVSQCVEAVRLCIERLPCMRLPFDVLSSIRQRYGDATMRPIYNMIEEYMRLEPEYLNFGKLNGLLKFMGSRNDLFRPEFQQLRINLSPSRPEPVLIRSLPLLVTLARTTQLIDATVLMFHDSTSVRSTAITTVIALCNLILRQCNVNVNANNSSRASSHTPPPPPIPQSPSTQSPTVLNAEVTTAVARLLDVAVADREPENRLSVLRQLSPLLYPYLCLPENLDALFMTRNDVAEAARVESLVLLCHLHPYHPTIIHPQLLWSQEYMLRGIDALDSSISQAIYKAGELKICAEHNSLLIDLNTVENVVLQRLRRQPFISRTFTTALLQLIQSVLEHSGKQHHCEMALFVQPVLQIINGGDSSGLRRVALEALGAILTIFNVRDRETFTDIHRSITRIIRAEGEEEEGVTMAAVRALSVIGAVNPVKMRRILRALESDEVEEEEVVTPAVAQLKPRPRIRPNMVNLYPSVTLYYLVRAMQLIGDPRQQIELLLTVRRLLRDVPGEQKAMLLTHLFPQLQLILNDTEKAHLYEAVLALLSDMAALMNQYRDAIPSTTSYQLLHTIQHFCARPQASQSPLSVYVVQVLDDMVKALPAQDVRGHRWAVEFIHQRLSQNKNDLELVHHVVKSLESFLVVMHEKDLQLILPHVLQCIEPAKTTPLDRRPKMKDINDACFDFINNVLVKELSLIKECCVQIVHTIMWYVELSDNQEEMDVGLNTIASLIDAMKAPATRFIMPVERVARQNGYADGYFMNLVANASTELKVRAPQSVCGILSPAQPLSMVSHLPRFSQREFDAEMRNTLHLSEKDYEVMDVSHSSGQTTVVFRFCPGLDRTVNFNVFIRKAQDTKSTLRRTLGILKVEQCVEALQRVNPAIIDLIAAIPNAKTQKREQSWISWLHNTALLLLRNSPYSALRCVTGVAERSSELSRDLFPFAASAVVNLLSPTDRVQLMTTFSMAVEKSPIDTKQLLFSFAEFMEAQRGESRPVMEKAVKQLTFVVEREDPTKKFGINYDQHPINGVIVTKLSTNGLGAKAGIPLGARLLTINGREVLTVGDIRGMIDGLTTVELNFSQVIEVRRQSEPKALIDLPLLARVAFSSQMHAKAIYFNEVLFEDLFARIGPLIDAKAPVMREAKDVAERLIAFYGHLGLTMVANGLMKSLGERLTLCGVKREQFGFDEVGTLEQLHWWSEALVQHRSRMMNPEDGRLDLPSFVGALRCEEALGHVNVVTEMIDKHWDTLGDTAQTQVAPFRAKAALALGAWDEFDEMSECHTFVQEFGVVERCAALFRLGRHNELLSYTQECRSRVLDSFVESYNESYSRSYDLLVELQHLRHFEELVSYVGATEERKLVLKHLWNRRLGQLSAKPAVLNTLISINSLVLTPWEDLSSQTAAIRVLTKSQWYAMASHLLGRLLGDDLTMSELCQVDPELIHVYMKHLFATQRQDETYTLLRNVLHEVRVSPGDKEAERWGGCWLLLGYWTMNLFPDRGDDAIEELLRATELSPHDYAAFHSLGILHQDLSRDPNVSQDVQTDHHISAVIALFKSVQLSSEHPNSVMQDVLRILSIWFAHCSAKELNEAVHHGVETTADHVWLNVIPQLIARIGITMRLARAILADLLVRVGTTYPQALIYPLTVAEKSSDGTRRLMAERVLSSIRVSDSKLVDEASLISNEMVRITILWTEKWHAMIHQAAFKQDDASAILRILRPLFEVLDHPTTPHERNFEKTFGQALRRAHVALKERTLDKAWSYLRQVYRQLSTVLEDRKMFMSEVSPTLDSIRDSIVAVPGTFIYGKPLVTIQKFHPRVYVMPSKQKPRRFGLEANDGTNYRFLLKGHEDMRQDERVMQFIGLINTIFLSDNATSAIGLVIPQYAVVPLTDNVGVVGWVENTETIFKMLETHRKERGVSIYEEVNYIIKEGRLHNVEDYHRQSKQQRKVLLSSVMDNTPDDELRRIIWERNDTCEQWLTYRETYGHTLAAMSMVGYVLGLGDRHLNNLMLQENGSVVHIDFGDCFEVAMHRAMYAEAVPFRLTRLLVRALGITGVDGVYRLTCELVMKNLRKHSENLLSILEAFIYDPLINWSLTVNESDKSTSRRDGGSSGNATGPAAAVGANNTLSTTVNTTTTNAPASATTGNTDEQDVYTSPTAIGLIDVAFAPPEQPMQLSKSFARQAHSSFLGAQTLDTGEGEIRNQQGDLALARVQAKLTGQDFGSTNASFSALRGPWRRQEAESQADSAWGSRSEDFGDSAKEYAGVQLPTTYLSLRALTGIVDSLDVPHQVDRLIGEATSLDNLADAYVTGWAPFW